MITFVVYVLCTSNTAKPGITETRLIHTVLTLSLNSARLLRAPRLYAQFLWPPRSLYKRGWIVRVDSWIND